MKRVFFIGGIHGVGKSTAAKKLSNHFNLPYYTASQIIREMKDTQEDESDKRVKAINDNQKLLILGLDIKLEKEQTIILDGHFTLQDSNSNIIKIDLYVFRQIHLCGIVLLQESAKEIQSRLSLRDNSKENITKINEHQITEENHADVISTELNVPIIKLFSYKDSDLISSFNNFLKS